MIGAAGISAFPMSGRIVHKMGLKEDPQNFLLMHSIGVNVSGQIASVIAGGIALGGRYPLSLPCGARTFLTASLSASPRDCLSYSHNYFSPWRGACQRKMHCYFAVPALYYILNLYVQTKG